MYLKKGIGVSVHRKIFYSSLLGILTALQATVLLARLLSLRVPSSALTADVVGEWQSLLRPEWETVIYRGFVFFAITGAFLWVNILRFIPRLPRFAAAELVVTVAILGTCFKAAVYAGHPQLAGNWQIILLASAVLLKVFWPWVDRQTEALAEFALNKSNRKYIDLLLTVLMPLVIVLIIDVPNVQGAVARFFVGEQFHHNDSFIYGPVLAYASGAKLDVDVISQYGVGVGAIFGTLSSMIGGVSYENGLTLMVWGAIIYYVLLFFLLRSWINNTVLACAGVFLALKFQMFNAGVYPFAFTYGSATVLRAWFDIVVLWSLWAHSRCPRMRWLILAAAACGAQLFYIPSDGAYVSAMLAFYIFVWAWLNGGVRKLWILVVLLAAPAIMLLLMGIFLGPSVGQKIFWENLKEFVSYFLNGFGLTPIDSGLIERKFLASLMGFVLPVLYVLTLLFTGALLLLRKIHLRNLFACTLSVYGLCLYHYYVARSGPSSYYVVSVPFVMLLIFWISKAGALFPENLRRMTSPAVLLVSVLMLLLNQNFIAYPNRFNVSRNPLTDPAVAQPLDSGLPYFYHLYRGYNDQLKVPLNALGQQDEGLYAESDFRSDDQLLSYYRAESDFSVDAALIARLTKPDEPAALISSFEIKILIDAKRRPYFYYFPLAISHPLRSRTLVRSSIYTKDQLTKVLEKLDRDKPPYIFVERVLLQRPLPEVFYFYYSSMLYLVDHVMANYEVAQQGKYIVAMRYKGAR